MVIGKYLKDGNISVSSIDVSKVDRVILNFSSYEEANAFVDSQAGLINKEWFAFIPGQAFQNIGIIRDVPIEFSKENILFGIEDAGLKKRDS